MKPLLFLTGGTSGIGAATVLLAAQQGYRVLFTGRNKEAGTALLHQIGGAEAGNRFLAADLSSMNDIKHLFDVIKNDYGYLDAACHCAGTDVGIGKLLTDTTLTEYDEQMGINLKAVWLCMKAELALMLPKGKGHIVNVSSVNGLGGAAGGSLYAAAKAGVIALSKSAAQEYAAQGIRINVVCPGAFRTPMLQRVFQQVHEDPAVVEGSYTGIIPLQRIGDPAEAAAAILWLLSPASSFMIGHSVILDGGMSAPFR